MYRKIKNISFKIRDNRNNDQKINYDVENWKIPYLIKIIPPD